MPKATISKKGALKKRSDREKDFKKCYLVIQDTSVKIYSGMLSRTPEGKTVSLFQNIIRIHS